MKYVVNLLINLSPFRRFIVNWILLMVSKFRKTNYKSPRNSSVKPLQFLGCVLSLPLAFLWLGNTKECYKSYLKAARD